MPPERIGSRYGEVESACSTSRTLTLWTESESPSSPPHTPFVPPPIPAAPRSRTRLGLRRLPPGTYLGTSVPTEAWGRSPVLHLPTRARFVVAAPSRSPSTRDGRSSSLHLARIWRRGSFIRPGVARAPHRGCFFAGRGDPARPPFSAPPSAPRGGSRRSRSTTQS